jgi:hypothetical protein
MWLHPNNEKDGWIRGEYPGFKVQDGDHLIGVIGCKYDSKDCKVTYRVLYRNPSGKVKELGAWTETYNEEITRIDIDLSSLAGKTVEFILVVEAKGSSVGDNVFWLGPGIERNN